MADSTFLDDAQLRQELLKFDVTVNKVTVKNREILVKKLNHMKARQRMSESPPPSPGRKSPGRAKQSPPRRSHAPAVEPQFSSDEDDSASGSRAAQKVTQRQMNLRRRTVDNTGSTNGERIDDATTSGRFRGATSADAEPISAGKSKRRSFVGTTNSPYQAGSLRNPVLLHSGDESGPRRRSGRVNNSWMNHEGESSGSDSEYTFTELATTGVNTTPSLFNTSASASLSGDLRNQQRTGTSGRMQAYETEKKDAGITRDRCSSFWRLISHCLIYTVLAFFVAIVIYYVAMRASTRPELMPSSADNVLECQKDSKSDNCIRKDEWDIVREVVVDTLEILSRRAGEHDCEYTSLPRYMTKDELTTVLKLQYGKTESGSFRKALTIIQKNPQWGIQFTDKSLKPIEDVEGVIYLESDSADKSLWCRLALSCRRLVNYILLIAAVFAAVVVFLLVGFCQWRKWKREKLEVQKLVEDIISLLQNHAVSCRSKPTQSQYLAVPHVRDALIPLAERKQKQHLWTAAVKYLSMHESRVREEIKTINGEECNVWCWIDSFPDTAVLAFRSQRDGTASSKCTSPCLRIQNMLDPSESYDEQKLSDAVLQRCGPHSGMLHIGTTSDAPDSVYVKFVSEAAAGQGFRALHGWTYDGRLTSVQEVRPGIYTALFPKSVNAVVPLRAHTR